MVLASLLLAAGRGKSGPAASGELSSPEKGLFAYLPGTASIVAGGSYKDFAGYWKNSPLRPLVQSRWNTPESATGGWLDCMLKAVGTAFAATVEIGDAYATARGVISGITAAELEACAGKLEGSKVAKEAGGKFVVVVVDGVPGESGPQKAGWYFLDDKTVFLVRHFPLVPAAKKNHRFADLAAVEAALAAAKESPSVDNKKLVGLANTARRDGGLWMCGSAESL
ncbi:MAG: hypothetical protein ACI9MR_001243 [Myxococcota bacterium]|jgi:hypothetical protein